MNALSRRGFLKGSALGATAVVLGWRPSLPVSGPPVTAMLPPSSVPGIVKLAAWIPVSNELLADQPDVESYVRRRLTNILAEYDDDGLTLNRCLDERFDSARDLGDGWVRNETVYRLTQEWEVEASTEMAERLAEVAA